MKLRSALLAASIMALPFAASAQPVTGLYVGAGVGFNYHQQEAIKGINTVGLGPVTIPTTGNLKSSGGFGSVVSLGWGFGNGLRAEVEGDYRNNNIPGFTGIGGGSLGLSNGGGRELKYGGMANVLYDFVGLTPYVQPYIGAGVGAQWVNMQNLHAYNSFPIAGTIVGTIPPGGLTATNTDNAKVKFAYQAILGAAMPLPQIAPGLALTLEYRFLGTSGNRTYNANFLARGTGGEVAATRGSFNLGKTFDHAALVGIRYNFGVAPPPPPPAPAPAPVAAPARSYLVFFDWDKATLTDRARQIIREAADNSTKVQVTRIEVNGYTDTSGTAKYNMGLSIRRANAVKAELIKDGVPANIIQTQGFGETHLLVPTGPGVREPQNRRVEIILH